MKTRGDREGNRGEHSDGVARKAHTNVLGTNIGDQSGWNE